MHLERQLKTLDAQLRERECLLDEHPRTAAWCRRCTERPAFKRAR